MNALPLTLVLFLGPQGTANNPPDTLRPGPTKTGHEIGVTANISLNPTAFLPNFNWRYHVPKTGHIGILSGLYLGLDGGPAIDFNANLWGNVGFQLGYEIDPWSNLALTFSPMVHNDFHFDDSFFQFAQTFGLAMRLYVNQHWVIIFEPGGFGYQVGTNTNFQWSYRGGWGFAYKF